MSSHRRLETPVGPLHLAANESGLTHAVWLQRDHGLPTGDGSAAAIRIVDQAATQLGEYFAGRRDHFDLPLALAGTELRLAIWQALARIPRGRTITYGELAARMGRPRAGRFVGSAVGANPLSIILPCHRVIGADGSLRGYAGGLPAKSWLLAHEGACLI